MTQRQLSSSFSAALLIPSDGDRSEPAAHDVIRDVDMTSSQVLVADAASDGVDTLWVVAPVCVAVVCIFILALIVVLTRY